MVSAPSGAGKTTLCKKLCEFVPEARHSVSCTTRPPRPGEIDGVHYTFVDEDEFRSMIEEGEFVEWAEVHGNFYGTMKRQVYDQMDQGFDVVMDIDVQGAKQIRESLKESVLIFVFPPSMEELARRLTSRQSDSTEVIDRRLKKARDEMKEYGHYDNVIVNDLFDEALKELMSIVVSERTRLSKVDRRWIEENFLKEDQV